MLPMLKPTSRTNTLKKESKAPSTTSQMRTTWCLILFAFLGGVSVTLAVYRPKITRETIDKSCDVDNELSGEDQWTPSFLYYNLSCPFEWSKYSCVHQSKLTNAEHSWNFTRMHFHTIQESLRIGVVPPRTRVMLVGDSLMRQLFISMACLAIKGQHVRKFRVDWMTDWPCHGTPNCIPGGNHSGFNVGSLLFHNGGELHFLPHSGSLRHSETQIVKRFAGELENGGGITFGTNTALPTEGGSNTLSREDVLVFNIGIHNTGKTMNVSLKEFAHFGDTLLKIRSRPRLIYVTTPTQHFPTDNGQYDMHNHSSGCIDRVEKNVRKDAEMKALTPGKNVDLMLNYNDLELGSCHIGGDDCSHYCMPGVPDFVASRLIMALRVVTPSWEGCVVVVW